MRAVLGLLVVAAHANVRRAVRASALGAGVARWMAMLAVTQFHFLYYASRPLPNIFALILGTDAIDGMSHAETELAPDHAGCGY